MQKNKYMKKSAYERMSMQTNVITL